MGLEAAKRIVAEKVQLPPGYQLIRSGQYEYLQRVVERLWEVVPITLFIVFLLLYFNTGSLVKTTIILLAVPFSAIGAIWFLYLPVSIISEYNFGTRPSANNLRKRNSTTVGLSQSVIMVEAPIGSGTFNALLYAKRQKKISFVVLPADPRVPQEDGPLALLTEGSVIGLDLTKYEDSVVKKVSHQQTAPERIEGNKKSNMNLRSTVVLKEIFHSYLRFFSHDPESIRLYGENK